MNINSYIEIFAMVMIYSIISKKVNVRSCIINLIIAIICSIKSEYISFVDSNIINLVTSIIIIILIFKLIYKANINETIIRLLICVVIMLVAEAGVGIIAGVFKIDTSGYGLTLILILSLTIIGIITELFIKDFIVELEYKILDNIKIYSLPIFNFLLLLFIFQYISKKINFENIEMTCLFFAALSIIVINIIATSYITKEIRLKKALEIENQYNPILEQYFESLKATEHEYKNHLNIIYTMLEVSADDEIRDLVKGYIKNTKNHDHLAKLMYLDNHVLKSLIYSKTCEADVKGIKFEYSINTNIKNLKLDNTELVILLSNLLNNAIEAAEVSERKRVNLSIEEIMLSGKEKYRITVKNTVKDIKILNVSEIFAKGYSTKGKNRGFGLYNVQKLIKRLNGDITIEIDEDVIIIEIIM
ncbi:two-component system, AgrA family, sensor histidine kinase AgrC [Clostridium cavendishii DSM 21758]|uniref:Two-component system, AgrA family, sensor histidine kinase AgrC n=1 Tax=Clostridium cavendishii DSM 21758 TaxID=1121302 RepID=A0A1M6J5C4_9CLOT|nr:ATP-binding protein [Clostridium cavendishii]SHJ41888.1 two-component system, AgrA family, sensor histidine kinase AgrC [Clostridium cavendishii DSM 21758]